MSRTVHLQLVPDDVAGNDGLGRIFLLPGSVGRAREIAEHFVNRTTHDNPRHLDVHTGQLVAGERKIDVGTVSTGMGCPSVGIVVHELFGLGVRRMLRVGSSGSLQPAHVRIGDVVVATGAVRDEGASDAFCPREVPSVAHPDWVRALRGAAVALGYGEHAFTGVVHSKDSLYGREFPSGPQADANERYMAVLRGMGVLASEMESSHLFVLAAALGPDHHPVAARGPTPDVVKAGAVLAILSDETGWAGPEAGAAAEARAVQVALAAIPRLA